MQKHELQHQRLLKAEVQQEGEVSERRGSKGIADQLRKYGQNPDDLEKCGERTLHSHLVLVVESRQILVSDMNNERVGKNSEWVELWNSEKKARQGRQTACSGGISAQTGETLFYKRGDPP